MTAITQDGYGPSSVLAAQEIAIPAIDATEVLVRVHAAGVNIADWAIMNGLPYIARPVYGLRKPKNPVRGTDVAGTVEAVGSDVTRFKPGDEVFGWADGSFAAYAAAPQDKLARKPSNVTFEQAAAVPLAGLVAIQGVRDHGRVGPGQKVLVNGASGGIGSFAVQIAKSLGAEVTGVTSTRNMELVRSIGADHVIDYRQENFTQGEQTYDFILDNVSNHSMADLRRVLAPTGMLIPNGGRFDNRWFASGGLVVRAKLMDRFVGHQLRTFLVAITAEHLDALRELIEAGKVTPMMDRVYPLAEAAEAMRHVGDGHARGKVAISVIGGAA
ncbi:MAG TPA: NAD(P)-dependent alcohol dehydrogenase [Candidatus Limnocylindria bacterium]